MLRPTGSIGATVAGLCAAVYAQGRECALAWQTNTQHCYDVNTKAVCCINDPKLYGILLLPILMAKCSGRVTAALAEVTAAVFDLLFGSFTDLFGKLQLHSMYMPVDNC